MMGNPLDFTRNRHPKNELDKAYRENPILFQTVVNGTIPSPALYSVDDGFLGLRKPKSTKFSRVRSGSSIPYDAGSSLTLGEASLEIHERMRKQRESNLPSRLVPNGESIYDHEDLTPCSSQSHTPNRPPSKKWPCLSFFKMFNPFKCGWGRRRSPSSSFLLINQMNQSPLPTIDETKPMRDSKKKEERSERRFCLLCCANGSHHGSPLYG